jgi:Flp pilus assembly pilin Flp
MKGIAMKHKSLFRKFLSLNEGATSVEYAILASAIAAIIITTVFLLGLEVLHLFQDFYDTYPR